MGSVVTSSIGVLGAPYNRQYSDPSSWDVAVDTAYSNNLVTALSGAGVIPKGEVHDDGGVRIAINSIQVMGGSTASVDCFKWLAPASGRAWYSNLTGNPLSSLTPGAGFYSNGNGNPSIYLSDNYSLIEGMVLTTLNSGSVINPSRLEVWGVGAVARNMIIEARTTANATYMVNLDGNGSALLNSFLIYRGTGTVERAIRLTLASGETAYVLANTIVRASDLSAGGTVFEKVSGQTGTAVVRGNAIFGWNAMETGTGATFDATNSGYNATNLTSGLPGTTGNLHGGSLPSPWGTAGSIFENTTAANGDWRLASGSPLAGVGARITSPSNPAGSDGSGNPIVRTGTGDLDGALRARSTSTPSIGAWEGASSGGSFLLLAAHHYDD